MWKPSRRLSLSQVGANVTLVGRSIDNLQGVEVEVQDYDVEALPDQCDARMSDGKRPVDATSLGVGWGRILVINAHDLSDLERVLCG